MGHLYRHAKRIILITAGIAALAGGPTAAIASAAPNDGGTSGYDCANGKKWFDQRVSDYNNSADKNSPAAQDAKKDAQNEKDRATAAGCDTSGWIVPFTISSTGIYTPVHIGGALQPPTSGGTTTTSVKVTFAGTRTP